MAKYEILIKAVTIQGMTYGQAAARYGVSKTLVHKLHHRWMAEGDAAYEPRSRRPRTTPNRTPDPIRKRVIELRNELTTQGLDAGPDTIAEHLARERITRVMIKGLRHTHATLLLELGEHPKVVQERLGHSTITTTMNIYSHVTPTMQRSAVDRFAAHLNS